MVKLKIMNKKYGALGVKNWSIDSDAFAQGLTHQAENGKH